MKEMVLALVTLLSTLLLSAQNPFCISCIDDPYEEFPLRIECLADPAEQNVNSYAYKKLLHFDFHESMKHALSPSTVNSISNYRWHNSGYQKKPFIMDGDLNFPIALRGPNTNNWMHSLQVIPRFKVRIFNNDPEVPYGPVGDTSNPVRTPSAMPGLAWYFTKHDWWTLDGEYPNSKSHEKYFGIYAYHHSNGQDGNELDTTSNGDIRVNQYNGNFGEQLIFEFILGGRVKLPGFDDLEVDEDESDRIDSLRNIASTKIDVKISQENTFYWRISYEWRPDAWTNKVFDKYDIYGKNRLRGNFAYSILPTYAELISDGNQWCIISNEVPYERFRFSLDYSYILDANLKTGLINDLKGIDIWDISKRLNLLLSLHYIPSGTQNLGIYLQGGYIGSDEYNIYFQDSYASISFGLSFAFFKQPSRYNLNALINN